MPNHYAVAGQCEKTDCGNVFCSLHWRRSNHLCREHGYEVVELTQTADCRHVVQDVSTEVSDKTKKESAMSDAENAPTKDVKANGAKAKKAMKETLSLVKKLGTGAVDLLGKLKKDKSPQAMLETIEASRDINVKQREAASARVERLFHEITEKKKAFKSAPKARQRVLEMELRSRMSEYKASERELSVLLENERVLSTVKGRFHEILAYGMRGISEIAIDDLTDDVEDAAAEADSVIDATRDLEKAGRRRERESDTESFWDELDGFEVEDEAEDSSQESEARGQMSETGSAKTEDSGRKTEDGDLKAED